MPIVKWILVSEAESTHSLYSSSGRSSKSSLDYIFGVVSFLVLEFLWKVQLAVEKYFSITTNERPSDNALSTRPDPIPPDILPQKQPKGNRRRRKKGLFFDPESGRRRSYQSLEDLISPAEERMLMTLCSKGPCDKSAEYEDCADLLRPEHQIPRSKFTAVWVESCGVE